MSFEDYAKLSEPDKKALIDDCMQDPGVAEALQRQCTALKQDYNDDKFKALLDNPRHHQLISMAKKKIAATPPPAASPPTEPPVPPPSTPPPVPSPKPATKPPTAPTAKTMMNIPTVPTVAARKEYRDYFDYYSDDIVSGDLGYAPYEIPKQYGLRHSDNASKNNYNTVIMSISLVFNVVLFALLICGICSLCVAVYSYFVCKMKKAQEVNKDYGLIAPRQQQEDVDADEI